MASQIVRGCSLPVVYKSTLMLATVMTMGTSDKIRRTGDQSWNGGPGPAGVSTGAN